MLIVTHVSSLIRQAKYLRLRQSLSLTSWKRGFKFKVHFKPKKKKKLLQSFFVPSKIYFFLLFSKVTNVKEERMHNSKHSGNALFLLILGGSWKKNHVCSVAFKSHGSHISFISCSLFHVIYNLSPFNNYVKY